MSLTAFIEIDLRVLSKRELSPDQFADEYTELLRGRIDSGSWPNLPRAINYRTELRPSHDPRWSWCEVKSDPVPLYQGAELGHLLHQALVDFESTNRISSTIYVSHPDIHFSPFTTATKVNEAGFLLTHLARDYMDFGISTDHIHHTLLDICELDPQLQTSQQSAERTIEAALNRANPDIGRIFPSQQYVIRDLQLGEEDARRALNAFVNMAQDCARDENADYFRPLAELILATSALFGPLMPAIKTTTRLVSVGDEAKTLAGDIRLEGRSIASAAIDDGFVTLAPAGVDSDHLFSIEGLGARSLRPMLATMALRQAEMHLIGLPFEHPSAQWQDIVHKVAQLIIRSCHMLPKWKPFIRPSPSRVLH